ncbi:MAG: pyridoxine 5'-phosphate synthase [Acidobacteria bacterium]|nr:pyridoxine 5'-phosphate synthase [Acidobacteriota bacterium]
MVDQAGHQRPQLVVSVDQVAMLRETRKARLPDPVHFALEAEQAGANGIKAHLRLDRRHIQDYDVHLLARLVKSRFFLQLSPNQDISHIVNELRPQNLVLAAERRDEIATENGLDVSLLAGQLLPLIRGIDQKTTRVFLLVDPVFDHIRAAAKLEVHGLMINLRDYALASVSGFSEKLFREVRDAVKLSSKYGLETHLVNAIRFDMVPALSRLDGVAGIQVGHDLVSRALMTGTRHTVTSFLSQFPPHIPEPLN